MNRPQGGWRRILEDPKLAAELFPSLSGLLAHPTERRKALKLLAASIALGALEGCGDPAHPDRNLVSAVVAPPGIIPGVPNYYATANLLNGVATGVVVKHLMGRPIKVEGNPHHPSSLGATDTFGQAMLLDFYDPDRSVGLMRDGGLSDRQTLLTALAAQRARLAETRGAGFRILTGSITSPTLGAMIKAVLDRYPEARWHQWEAISRDSVHYGAVLAYGRALETVPRLHEADVVLGLDSDLISSAPGHVRYARDFASRRNPVRAEMSRVYAVEPTWTLLGGRADHRFIAGPGEMHVIVAALAGGILHNQAPSAGPDWVQHVIADLKAAHGRAFIHAGSHLPAETHALVHAMNEALGGRGKVYDLIPPPAFAPAEHGASMRDLRHEMESGAVETLVVIDSNPVFTAPGFGAAMKGVKQSFCIAPWLDETGAVCNWYVPGAHIFEAWGDARGHDGTVTILQPQSLPLFDGRSAISFLSLFLGPSGVSSQDAVRRSWVERLGGEGGWNAALARGLVPDTAHAPSDAKLKPEAGSITPPAPAGRPVEILFRPDEGLWDGRFANNPWLQEMPRSFTKLTWDNPLLISPDIARRYGFQNGDITEIAYADQKIRVPVWIMPGQAKDCAVAWLGFGREMVGAVGAGAGFNYYPLRASDAPATLRRINERVELATTRHHSPLNLDLTEILRHGRLDEFKANPHFLGEEPPLELIFRRPPPAPVGWGMSVDLNACIGCNACVIACMAENNVPVVGKESVIRAREMHWLRIDGYFEGSEDDPRIFFEPMLCQQCEQAPCEVVCPVEAAVHDDEGLNLQVYNRCIGTRFCSNNCPYKVRRFNFFNFTGAEHRPAISRNPDVTVRQRGVMEKCTFCVQRIAAARIEHDRDGVPERAVTACQAACPTQAFTFGDIKDPESEVAKRKKSPLDFTVLYSQATVPRVTYEAHIVNPNPLIGA